MNYEYIFFNVYIKDRWLFDIWIRKNIKTNPEHSFCNDDKIDQRKQQRKKLLRK